MSKLLTIIVTYNAMRWVDRCLGSVRSATVPSDMFIVDNGSTDGTREYIAEYYPEVVLIRSEVNLMFGRANNLGFEYALKNGYDYVYLLNQDAWVAPDAFEKLIAGAVLHNEYGILSPVQLSSDWKTYEYFFNWLVVNKLPGKESDIETAGDSDVLSVRMVQAAHWLLTRRCIEMIGGFSPSFPHYGEDDNYCQRVLFHGLNIGIVPMAKAVHDATNAPLVTNKQKRYRHFITFVIALSDVMDSQPLHNLLLFLLRRAKGLAVERKSLTSFSGFFKAVSHLCEIRKNRRLSMTQKCAFLHYEQN